MGGQDAPASYLIGTRLDLQFNPHSDYSLDVTRFLDLVATCRAHDHSSHFNCSECAYAGGELYLLQCRPITALK